MKTIVLALCMFLLISGTGIAGENPGQQKSNVTGAFKGAVCVNSVASADIDIGNVRAKILVGGDMWWDLTNPRYEVPKGSGKNSLFSGGLWFGGMDAGNQVYVAAQTYRQTGNDYWPGPIDTVNVSTDASVCLAYDKIWKVTRAEIVDFVQNGTTTQGILTWPGNGNAASNQGHFLAPFHDVNGDGIYDPASGDYPNYDLSGGSAPDCCEILHGDQTLWWAFNDVGNVHTETSSAALGLEIHAQGFGFNSGTEDIDNATFYQYKIINRSAISYNNCYVGIWTDPDLGNAVDDYVGCDVGRGMGYCYNGDSNDETIYGYGLNPPAIGIDFLEGPLADAGDGIDNDRDGITDEAGEQIIMSKFVYYNNMNNTPTGNPNGFVDYYNYLRGIWLDNIPMTYGGDGRDPGNPPCNFMFPDDTDTALNATNGPWTEITAGNLPEDRRFILSAGQFTFLPGEVRCITVGVPWARDTSTNTPPSLARLKQADDVIQALFDNCFVMTGIANLDANPFQAKISPVPFHDETTVSFNNKNGRMFTLTVYDIRGSEVRKINNIQGNSITIKRQGMQDGIYLFSLSDDKGNSWVQKVVVN